MVATVSIRALGTTATAVLTDPAGLVLARSRLVRGLRALDLACSRFRPDSELTRLNRSAGRPTAVGELLLTALEAALAVARMTGGLVDPTVGRAMRGNGYDRTFSRLTNGTLVPVLSPAGRFEEIELDPDAGTVLVPTGIELDLGASAKALAADRLAAEIAADTGAGVLVSLGGDLAIGGPPPVGRLGRRGRRRPRHSGRGRTGPGRDRRRRARELRHPGAALAHGGRRLPPHRRPAHGTAGARPLVDRHRRGRLLPGRECREHRLDRAREGRAGLARGAPAAGPARAARRRRRPCCRLAGRRGGGMTMALLAAGGSKTMWYLTRGSGAVTLVLLTLSMCLGIVGTRRWRSERVPRFSVAALHRNLTLLTLVFLALHVLTSVADTYAPIGLKDAFVPFASAYRPFWLGLGALACDLLLALVLTSLVRVRIGHQAWRLVHWLAYACWPLALLHALGTGSDPRTGWLQALAAGSLALVLAAVALRLARGGAEPALRLAGGGAVIVATLAAGIWYATGRTRPAGRVGPARRLRSCITRRSWPRDEGRGADSGELRRPPERTRERAARRGRPRRDPPRGRTRRWSARDAPARPRGGAASTTAASA